MLNILSHPYLSLDQYIDIKSFDEILDDIIIAVSKSLYAQGPCYTGPGYLDKTKKSVHDVYREIMSSPSHPYFDKLKNLKNWEPYNFIKYKWPGHTLGQCLVLSDSKNKSYMDKHEHTKCVDHPIKQNFDVLFKWIDKQNIFSSYGRSIVFLNEKDTSVLEHRDYYDGISRKDEFIWISPLGNKSFYIRDETTKVYMNSRFCYFDNANIHGSDQLLEPTFSIRIDGKFSDEFISKTGLKDHFND